MRQFRQITYWDDNAEFNVTGKELKELFNSIGEVENPEWFEPILERHLNSGIIKVKFEDLDGNEIPVEDIMKEVQEFYANENSPN